MTTVVTSHGPADKARRIALLGLAKRDPDTDRRFTWVFSHNTNEGVCYLCRHCGEQIHVGEDFSAFNAATLPIRGLKHVLLTHACAQMFENLRTALLLFVDATPAQLNELRPEVLDALADTIDEDEAERIFKMRGLRPGFTRDLRTGALRQAPNPADTRRR